MNAIRKGIDWLADKAKPRVMMAVWFVFTLMWGVLLWPSLQYWSDSVAWIVIMSWWANLAASAVNYLAAHNDQETSKLQNEVSELKDLLQVVFEQGIQTYSQTRITNETLDAGFWVYWPDNQVSTLSVEKGSYPKDYNPDAGYDGT